MTQHMVQLQEATIKAQCKQSADASHGGPVQ